ncbi:hypothetical protein BD309DRAFT_990748 [Dichomitus squalens]|nr:hypothetical protein BD309DRAFT_990748 [Dichomitus squalens]
MRWNHQTSIKSIEHRKFSCDTSLYRRPVSRGVPPSLVCNRNVSRCCDQAAFCESAPPLVAQDWASRPAADSVNRADPCFAPTMGGVETLNYRRPQSTA